MLPGRAAESQIVASTLTNLHIDFTVKPHTGQPRLVSFGYSLLDIFFSHCKSIKVLYIEDFDFGDDPVSSTSQTVKDGFSRLKTLGLGGCGDDMKIFIKNTPIDNLQTLVYSSDRLTDEEDEIVKALAMKYRSITSDVIEENLGSFNNLLALVKCCPDLIKLDYCDNS